MPMAKLSAFGLDKVEFHKKQWNARVTADRGEISHPEKKTRFGANGPYFFYWLSVFPCTVAFICTNFQVNRLRTGNVSPSNVISHG